jgi:hypothetical protein
MGHHRERAGVEENDHGVRKASDRRGGPYPERAARPPMSPAVPARLRRARSAAARSQDGADSAGPEARTEIRCPCRTARTTRERRPRSRMALLAAPRSQRARLPRIRWVSAR